MPTLLRPSSRQLACHALAATQAASRIGVRRARIPRLAPKSSSSSSILSATSPSAFLLPRQRFYSTNPKPPHNDKDTGPNDAQKSEGQPAENGQPSLRPGWVKLDPAELEALEQNWAMIPKMLRTGGQEDTLFELIRTQGVPVEMRDLLRRVTMAGGSITLADLMKIHKIAKEIASAEVEFRKEESSRAHPPEASKSQNAEEERETDRSKMAGRPKEDGQPEEGEQSKKGEQPKQEEQPKKDDNDEFQKSRDQRKQHQGGKNKKDQKNNLPPRPQITTFDIILTGLAAAFLIPFLGMGGSSPPEISWAELRKNYLDHGLVNRLVVQRGDRCLVKAELNPEALSSVYPDSPLANYAYPRVFVTVASPDILEKHLDEAQDELDIPSTERIPVIYEASSQFGNLLLAFGPTLLLIGLIVWAQRRGAGGGGAGGGMFGFGKSKAKMYNHESAVKVKFADVAGMDEAKVEIMEFVSFLKTPERFQKLGAKIPRGAILSGPPGTGKTLLAKATAGESQVPFFSVSGSEFVEMFVGVGASRVRDLFATARKNSPCIIFIDEIDAIGRSRSDRNGIGGNEEREATLNQILTEMDGFNTQEQIVVLAGTNRPEILDKALMRPGRFDRQIYIDRPTMKGRVEIFKVHLKNIVTKEEINHLCGRLSALTPGFAGADIANAVNEAALVAARSNADSVTMEHFEKAIERVIGGLERKSLVLSPEEKKTVAYHEAGHAICGWFFEFADPLLKVSIIPRGQGALGYAQYLPVGDAYLMTTKQLMDRMAMTLGGRISEELHFPTVTTGASDDFRKVTSMATNMVTQWGMSSLGPLHFNQDQNQFNKPFAEATAQEIDAEVRKIVNEAYTQCKDLLVAKKKEVGIVAEELLKREMLTRDDMVRLLGARPFADKEEFTKYFDGSKSAPPPPPSEIVDDPPAPAPAMFKGRVEDS